MSATFSDDPLTRSWKPSLLSLLLHGLLVAFAVWWFAPTPPQGLGSDSTARAGQIVLAQLKPDSQQLDYESAESLAETAAETAEADYTPPAAESAPNVATPTPQVDLPGTAVDLNQLSASQMDGLKSSQAHQTTLSAADLEAIAREQQQLRSRQPASPLVSTQLFGSGAIPGRRFVFVIDRSSSMGDRGLGVLRQAEQQLTRAVDGLTPENFFQVLAYHSHATVIGERAMLAGTPENKAKVREFIGGLAAFGATNHESGLYAALALRPDAIIWLADGGYPELNTGQIRAFVSAAGRQVTVHALQFGSLPQEPNNSFMKKVATESGGTYLYIDVNTWSK